MKLGARTAEAVPTITITKGRAEPRMACFLTTAVEKYAPHHLRLIPDKISTPDRHRSVDQQMAELGMTGVDAAREEVARMTAAFTAKHGRRPGALSREQLAVVRAANLGVQKARAHQEALRTVAEREEAQCHAHARSG